MEQTFLDNFLQAEAEARESIIDKEARKLHLARQYARFDKALKVCKSDSMRKMLERYKQETLKLMRS